MDQVEEILYDSSGGFFHVAEDRSCRRENRYCREVWKEFFYIYFFYLLTPNDPIRVPVIEFGEPAAGYEEPVRQVNGRVSVGVHFDVFVHPSGQPLPYLIELQDPNP